MTKINKPPARVKELIIIGAGPAGITASVYAARKRMDFMVFTKDIGGQTAMSGAIENYIGFQFITGPELTQKFDEHIRQFGVEIKLGEEIKRISPRDNRIEVIAEDGKYESKTVIVATGRVPRRLNVPGEEEYRNRGVTYCATCDGPLFAGVDVAVVGGGNSALDAVLQLVKIARKVFLVQKLSHLTGDPIMIQKVKADARVELIPEADILAIEGKETVSALKFKQGGKAQVIEVKGVFIEIGSEPASHIVDKVKKNEQEEIIVNCRCETNIPGLFAAGDVTNVTAKQIIVAAGEGAKAALSAFAYLNKTGGN